MYIIMTTDDRWPPTEVDEDFAEDDDDQEAWPQDPKEVETIVMSIKLENAYRGLMRRRGQEARMQ